jgi:salicylate hydroxylase
MALEDALVLARCLEGDDDLPRALASYEQARRPRTNDVVRHSNEHSKRIQNPALAAPAMAVGFIEKNWAPDRIKGLYDWIFEYDAVRTAIDMETA